MLPRRSTEPLGLINHIRGRRGQSDAMARQDSCCRHSVSAACVSMVFTGEQISATTWKIVEDDRFGQYPFVYVRLGTDKCIVIGARVRLCSIDDLHSHQCGLADTGCGSGPLRKYIDKYINKGGLPYYVVCTHVHFDVRGMACLCCSVILTGAAVQHIGGAYQFSGTHSEGM